MPVLERLAHRVESVARELEHLIEKEHAEVRKADLSGPRRRAAADESRGGNRVMRRAKRARRDKSFFRPELASDRMDLRDATFGKMIIAQLGFHLSSQFRRTGKDVLHDRAAIVVLHIAGHLRQRGTNCFSIGDDQPLGD